MGKVLKLRTTPPPSFSRVTLVVGLGMLAFAVFVMIESISRWPPNEGDMAGSAMFAFWGTVIAEVSRRSLAHGTTYLRIDRARDTLTYVDDRVEQETIALVDLGELHVDDHKLRAATLPDRVLFCSPLLLDVEQRRVQLERIIGQAQIRQLLSLDAPDGGAYRDDPELAFHARQLIPNLVRLREVLDLLGSQDARVVALRRAIDSSPDRDRSA
jgi:hypothetical protein